MQFSYYNNLLSFIATFLNPCDFNDPNLNTCFAVNLQVLFREWRDGEILTS